MTCAFAAKAAFAAKVIIAAIAPPMSKIDTHPKSRSREAARTIGLRQRV